METTNSLFETEALVHLNALYRTAVHLTGDRTAAEDLVQETFLQAWKSFSRYTPGTNCRAWLYGILFNVVRHHRRKWSRLRLRFESEYEESEMPEAVYEPPLPHELRDEDLLAALAQLPEAHRAIVLLVDVEEFTYKEAADALAVPVGTVMSRLSRARANLRKTLAGYPLASAAVAATTRNP